MYKPKLQRAGFAAAAPINLISRESGMRSPPKRRPDGERLLALHPDAILSGGQVDQDHSPCGGRPPGRADLAVARKI